MPRSGWLAVGATLAALALGADLGAHGAILLTSGIVGLGILAVWLGPRRRRLAIAVSVGAAAIALRVAAGPSAPPLSGVPDGRGPWTMLVETVGSPRDGQQVATLRTVAAGPAGFRLAATLPRYPAIEPGDTVEVEGRTRPRPDSPYGQYLERLGAWGSLDADTLRPLDAPDGSPGPGPGAPAPCRGRRPDRDPPGTRGGPGGGHPYRAARPSRPRRRGGVHDRGREPCRRDLGLEHRDRRSGDRGGGRPVRSTASCGRHGRRHRRIHRVRGRFAVGAARRRDGRRRPARPRDGPGRVRRGSARLGGRRPPAGGPGPRGRCRVPALHGRDRRADRLGHTRVGTTDANRWRPAAAMAGGEPRGLARRPGGDAARSSSPRSGVSLSSPRRSTCSSCRSWPRRWRPVSWPSSPGPRSGWVRRRRSARSSRRRPGSRSGSSCRSSRSRPPCRWQA